jgi:hypothetical protein
MQFKNVVYMIPYIITYHIIVYITTAEYQVCPVLCLIELINILNYTHIYGKRNRLNSY